MSDQTIAETIAARRRLIRVWHGETALADRAEVDRTIADLRAAGKLLGRQVRTADGTVFDVEAVKLGPPAHRRATRRFPPSVYVCGFVPGTGTAPTDPDGFASFAAPVGGVELDGPAGEVDR